MAINIPYSDAPVIDYNPYASGNKRYGSGARSAPNVGAVRDKTGYAERDLKAKARRQAITDQLSQGQRRLF